MYIANKDVCPPVYVSPWLVLSTHPAIYIYAWLVNKSALRTTTQSALRTSTQSVRVLWGPAHSQWECSEDLHTVSESALRTSTQSVRVLWGPARESALRTCTQSVRVLWGPAHSQWECCTRVKCTSSVVHKILSYLVVSDILVINQVTGHVLVITCNHCTGSMWCAVLQPLYWLMCCAVLQPLHVVWLLPLHFRLKLNWYSYIFLFSFYQVFLIISQKAQAHNLK